MRYVNRIVLGLLWGGIVFAPTLHAEGSSSYQIDEQTLHPLDKEIHIVHNPSKLKLYKLSTNEAGMNHD